MAQLFSLGSIARMATYPKQIVIGEPLWSFMHHCEVYCSGACCGIQAFEVHPALLLRKTADLNLTARDASGSAAFQTAWRQIVELRQRVGSVTLKTVHDEVPFWSSEPAELPEFWLPASEVADWLEKWEKSFTEASRYGGHDKHAA